MAATASSEQSYRVNEPDVIHQLFDREVVVVDLRNGSYYSLSESGGAAWLAFGSGGALVGDVARLLTAVYTIPPDVAARDLQAFIDELTTRDLIGTCPPGTLSAATATVATATAAYSPPELRSYNDLQELFLLDPVHAVDAAAGWPNAAAGEAAVPPPAAPEGAAATAGVDGAATGGDVLTARLGGHTLLVNRDTGVYSTLDADRGITVHHDLKTLMRPWIKTDRVEDVSAVVELSADGRGSYEFSVPLKTLGLVPSPGLTIKADVGILRGSAGVTIERLYWHNKGTGLTADLPGEAMLTPAMWGEWRIGAE